MNGFALHPIQQITFMTARQQSLDFRDKAALKHPIEQLKSVLRRTSCYNKFA